MTRLTNRSTPRRLLAFAGLLSVLMLAGCGSSAPAVTRDPDAATQTDAPADTIETAAPAGDGENGSAAGDCSLWTLDEVTAAAGVTATDATPTDLQGQFVCNYSGADGALIAGYVVWTSEAAMAPSEAYDAVSDGADEVSGIGDEAQWRAEGTLYVMSGGTLFTVSLFSSELEEQQKQDASIDLGRILIDRFQ